MMSTRRRARQFAVQALYQAQLNPDAPVPEIAADLRDAIRREFADGHQTLSAKADAFARRTPEPDAEEAAAHQARLDKKRAKLQQEQETIETLFGELFFGAHRNRPAYMAEIRPLLDRDENDLNPVEKAVLLMACHELAAMPETPYPVIINEAIEITKTFGGTDGYKFVNGILDKLVPQLRPNDPPRR